MSGQGVREDAGLSRQDRPEVSVKKEPETSGATLGDSGAAQGGDTAEQAASETGVDTEKPEE